MYVIHCEMTEHTPLNSVDSAFCSPNKNTRTHAASLNVATHVTFSMALEILTFQKTIARMHFKNATPVVTKKYMLMIVYSHDQSEK